MYKDADLPLPDYPADMDEKYSDLDRAFKRWFGLDRQSIRDPKHLLAMRCDFCTLSLYVDDKVGELLNVLQDAGCSTTP
jgi:choline-sulfatase